MVAHVILRVTRSPQTAHTDRVTNGDGIVGLDHVGALLNLLTAAVHGRCLAAFLLDQGQQFAISPGVVPVVMGGEHVGKVEPSLGYFGDDLLWRNWIYCGANLGGKP